MAEAPNTIVTPDGGTSIDPTVVDSGLPSDAPITASGKDTFIQVADEDFNDKGLFRGRWNNPQEMADYIKNLEDKHADTVRTQKNATTKTEAEIAETADAIKLDEARQAKLMELAPKFVDNGMQLTPEMEAELTELGLTESQVKLGAYEYRDRFNAAYDVVGGKEEYDAMMTWAVDGLSDADKAGFNKDLASAKASSLAMEGLHARYLKAGNGEAPAETRLRGQPAPQSAVRAYTTRAELFADKAFADSNRANSNDKAKYRARLAATPESVYL